MPARFLNFRFTVSLSAAASCRQGTISAADMAATNVTVQLSADEMTNTWQLDGKEASAAKPEVGKRFDIAFSRSGNDIMVVLFSQHACLKVVLLFC